MIISNIEKILIIDNKINTLDDMIKSVYLDINRINGGMTDPDYGIDKCYSMLSDLNLKKQALLDYKSSIV